MWKKEKLWSEREIEILATEITKKEWRGKEKDSVFNTKYNLN